MYKIAIVGASTLLGKELKDALAESSLAAADFALFDEDEGLGQLDQLGDEVTFVKADQSGCIRARWISRSFAAPQNLTRKVLARGAAGGVDGA